MIDKIYIPTVSRVNDQITYNSLPEVLKQKVTFVVQAWERDQYEYDADYLVLPPDIVKGTYKAVAKTRKFIYETAKAYRYAVLDDDLVFRRRNEKYWTGKSNMEGSGRPCDEDDILKMFQTFENWLDDGFAICSCGQQSSPPAKTSYRDNTSVCGTFWINGPMWSHLIPDLHLDAVHVAEDVLLVLGLLSRGYQNRVSSEYIIGNMSVATNKLESECWDNTTFDSVHEDHKFVQSQFPKHFKILYDDNGKRVKGGYRDFGKLSIQWSKTYKDYLKSKTSLKW